MIFNEVLFLFHKSPRLEPNRFCLCNAFGQKNFVEVTEVPKLAGLICTYLVVLEVSRANPTLFPWCDNAVGSKRRRKWVGALGFTTVTRRENGLIMSSNEMISRPSSKRVTIKEHSWMKVQIIAASGLGKIIRNTRKQKSESCLGKFKILKGGHVLAFPTRNWNSRIPGAAMYIGLYILLSTTRERNAT